MTLVDIIVLAFCGLAFVLGYKDGFVRKIIGTVGFILAVFLGLRFSDTAGRFVTSVARIEPDFARVIGGILLFIAAVMATSVIKRLVHPFDKVNTMINQVVGGLAGVLQILIFLSAVFYLLNIFKYPSEQTRSKSLFYGTVASVLPWAASIIKDVTPEAQKSIKTIIKPDSLRQSDTTE